MTQEKKSDYLLKVDVNEVFAWSTVLARRLDMVPCDKDGHRLDVGEIDDDTKVAALEAENNGLRAQLAKLDTTPARVTIAELRRNIAERDQTIAGLRAELAGATDTNTTLEVAGEDTPAGEPQVDDIMSQLEEFMTNTRGDKIALEAWCKEQFSIDLDKRKNYETLATEAREAASATMV